MINVTYPAAIDDSLLQFAVIMARYNNKWVFCRHKTRSTWEAPGGHREPGETIDAAALRVLLEETGAISAILQPVSNYAVTKDGITAYGKLFFATITELRTLSPETEMSEIGFFDTLPHELTYSAIHSSLYEQVQCWLNFQSGAGELWDIYTKDRRPTGRLHRRGDPFSPGDYHLVVHIWIQNSRGEFLLTKRSPNKGYPNMWECTGGSALAGDDSLAAALREVREETGLILLPENGHILMTDDGEDYIGDIWLFRQDFELADVVLQPGETCDVCYASAKEILQMYEDDAFVPYGYLKRMFETYSDILGTGGSHCL